MVDRKKNTRALRTLPRRLSLLGFALAPIVSTAEARALQPLAAFLVPAQSYNPDNRAAGADRAQRDAEADLATARLLPALTASGTYTRNQYEVDFALMGQVFPVLLQNQLDANVTLTVPLVDVGAWERRGAARAVAEASVATGHATAFEIDREVARAYYQLLGSEAVARSAVRALDVARANLKLVRDRKEGGTASELDVQRAEADVSRGEQSLSDARLNVTLARRSLATLSGVTPEPADAFPGDDLHEEPRLEAWLPGSPETLPAVAAAAAETRAADKNHAAAIGSLLPTLSASAQERFTNATAFTGGHVNYYLLQATVSWRLDATVSPGLRAVSAAEAGAAAREEKARREAEDAIYEAWNRVRAGIDKSRAARAQVKAASIAADLARERYTAGVATQLDVLNAQQEAFSADVARIQADADLSYARASLRLSSGRPLEGSAR